MRRLMLHAALSQSGAGVPQSKGEEYAAGAPMPESVKIFLSTVSDEFRAYRDQLRSDLTRPNVEVKVQEDFKDLGGDTLDKLDVYIAHCDAVVHLVGDMTGSVPVKRDVDALLAKYPDLVGEPAAARRGAEPGRWRLLYAMGSLARAVSSQAVVDRQGRRQSRARTGICADARLARGASLASGAAQGDGALSRLHFHQPRQSRQAYRLRCDSRSSREGPRRTNPSPPEKPPLRLARLPLQGSRGSP